VIRWMRPRPWQAGRKYRFANRPAAASLRRVSQGKLAGIVALIVVGIGVAGASVANAELEKAQGTEDGVTTYLSVQYSTTQCDGANAFKINMISRRWHRQSLRRTARARYQTQARGKRCNGDWMNESTDSGVFKPCFGCDGNNRRWSTEVTSVHRWPYLRQCGGCTTPEHLGGGSESLGAVTMTQTRTRRGRSLGVACVKITLVGALDSPVC
jgi:hypothetical protein